MRLSRWIPLTLAVLLVGCSKPAPPAGQTTVIQTPPPAPPVTAPAVPPATPPGPSAAVPAPTPPSTPVAAPVKAAEPIVGRWEMNANKMTIVFIMSADGTVAFDNEITRKSLRTAMVEQIEKAPDLPADKKQEALAQMEKSLDEQIGQFKGKWGRAGKLYTIRNVGPNGLAKPQYVKVDGDQLFPVDEKGVRKKGEPVGRRVAG